MSKEPKQNNELNKKPADESNASSNADAPIPPPPPPTPYQGNSETKDSLGSGINNGSQRQSICKSSSRSKEKPSLQSAIRAVNFSLPSSDRRGSKCDSESSVKSVRRCKCCECCEGVEEKRCSLDSPKSSREIQTGALQKKKQRKFGFKKKQFLKISKIFSSESSISSLQKVNVILPRLLEEETLFHKAVKVGDASQALDIIQSNKNFNVNAMNYKGDTALKIAIKEGHTDVLKMLLDQREIEIQDALLQAIKYNRINHLQLILDAMATRCPGQEYLTPPSLEFQDNVTPIILAAEMGNYEIVNLLKNRGHVIPRPHKPNCFCKKECLPIIKTHDNMSVAHAKFKIYAALSNPAYICQTSNDPILTAFKLSKEVKIASKIDLEFKSDYRKMAENLRIFAAQLIRECRCREELEIMLSKNLTKKSKKYSFKYPKLLSAIKYKQREFLASPNIQELIENIWLDHWYKWKLYSQAMRLIIVILRLILFPFIILIFIVLPKSSSAEFFALPVNRHINHLSTYFLFLGLIFIQSNNNKRNQRMGNRSTGLEPFIIVYILTSLISTLRLLMIQGRKRFYRFFWNKYQAVTDMIFILVFIFWMKSSSCSMIAADKSLERKYWNSYDPQLIAEGLFVVATILSFLKLLLFCQLDYNIGTLLIYMSRMRKDVLKFVTIFTMTTLSFAAGLSTFYSYYAGMKQTDPVSGGKSLQENSFINFFDTLKTLYFGLFGLASYQSADVVIENKITRKEKESINEHRFTEAVGYIVFSAYLFIMMVTLINMLCALISKANSKSPAETTMYWLYKRAEIYIHYMDQTNLPPPLNIIPTSRICCSFCKKNKHCEMEKGLLADNQNEEDFDVIMSQLVQRYFSHNHKTTIM